MISPGVGEAFDGLRRRWKGGGSPALPCILILGKKGKGNKAVERKKGHVRLSGTKEDTSTSELGR